MLGKSYEYPIIIGIFTATGSNKKFAIMTLVSVVNSHGNIVVVSDRAISDNYESNKILLPSTNDYTNQPTTIVGYNVKTILVKEILCIGFSGIVYEIELLISDIEDYFLHRPVNKDTLMEVFSELKDRYSCSAIYVLGAQGNHKDQILVLRSGYWIIDQSRIDLEIISSGSGAADWTSEVLENFIIVEGELFDSKFSRQFVLQSCIKFLGNERITQEILSNGWGGGFDIIYYDDDKFKRLDNVAYAFFGVDISNINTLTPLSIIHQGYSPGNAIIKHYEKRGFQTYVIPELGNKTVFDDNVCSESIAYEVISCIHLFKEKEHISDIAVLFWDNDPSNVEPTLFTTREGGIFGIKFRDIYFEKLKEAIENYLS